MNRRGSDKISTLHSGLIVGSFVLLAINLVLSWLTTILALWYPQFERITVNVSWMLYALVVGMLLSANLYKVPHFIKWLEKDGNGDA